ncbi:MAG: hypothetical protein M0Z76_08400 [Gammaproteobacteria bacterium]|nr:hypothetical protein [Gammaproteobacteria bacterium]
MSYLMIDLTARKTNMLQTLGIVSPAPVLPTILAMHALDKRLEGCLGVRGVGLIHRHSAPWIEHLDDKGYLKPALVQRRGAYLFDNEKKPTMTPMQPMALADIEWTLLLDCLQDVSDVDAVSRMLRTMPMAGGLIQEVRVRAFVHWEEVISMLRAGRWLDDVTPMLQSASHPVQALFSATRGTEGWVVPANLGYALLEDPTARAGARDGHPHAFVEDMMGLVRYTPLFQARVKGLKPANLWRYGWDGDQFLVTNQPDVSLTSGRSTAA